MATEIATNQDFITSMSPKGQVVISKNIRIKLGLKPKDKLIETLKGNKIIIEKLPALSELGGTLKGMMKGKTTDQIMKFIDEGWDT
jgi:AbrB family looped-hinge helix DNA binding protein